MADESWGDPPNPVAVSCSRDKQDHFNWNTMESKGKKSVRKYWHPHLFIWAQFFYYSLLLEFEFRTTCLLDRCFNQPSHSTLNKESVLLFSTVTCLLTLQPKQFKTSEGLFKPTSRDNNKSWTHWNKTVDASSKCRLGLKCTACEYVRACDLYRHS